MHVCKFFWGFFLWYFLFCFVYVCVGDGGGITIRVFYACGCVRGFCFVFVPHCIFAFLQLVCCTCEKRKKEKRSKKLKSIHAYSSPCNNNNNNEEL